MTERPEVVYWCPTCNDVWAVGAVRTWCTGVNGWHHDWQKLRVYDPETHSLIRKTSPATEKPEWTDD